MISILTLSVLTFGICGYVITSKDGLPGRYPIIEKQRFSALAFVGGADKKLGSECRKRLLNVELCSISNLQKQPTIALIGDSHANHLYPGLKEYYDNKNENLALLSMSSTIPFLNISSELSKLQDFHFVFEYLRNTPSIHTVILAGFWPSYFNPKGVTLNNTNYKINIKQMFKSEEEVSTENLFEEGLKETILFLNKNNKQVSFIYDIPTISSSFQDCLPRPHRQLKDKNCVISKAEDTVRQNPYRKSVDKILANNKQVESIDPYNFLCIEDSCFIKSQDEYLYSDEHHLSSYGARYLFKRLLVKKLL